MAVKLGIEKIEKDVELVIIIIDHCDDIMTSSQCLNAHTVILCI